MGTIRIGGIVKSGPSTQFWLEADWVRRDEGSNYSVLGVWLRAANGPSGSTGSFSNGFGKQTAHANGYLLEHNGNPFLPSGYGQNQTRWHDYSERVFYHNGNGFLGDIGLAMELQYGSVNETHYGSIGAPARIPKPPQRPAKPTLSNFTPTSVRVNGSIPDDMGAGIEEYQFAASPHDGSGQIFTSNAGQIHDVTGLAPGRSYVFQYRARNRMGWSDWSDGEVGTPGLPAPSFTSWAQNSTSELVAKWTAPSATTGLTGYRVQTATNDLFTENVRTTDVGNVLTASVAGLAGGRIHYARVAALTAGGVNAYSDSRNVMLVLAAGNFDNWSRIGSRPAGISYYTAEGIRRGTLGTSQALYLESTATAAAQLDADTFGMTRSVPTVAGQAYSFTARMTRQFDGTPTPTQGGTYRLAAAGVTGAAASFGSETTVDLPGVEFVATSDQTTIRVLLAQPLNVPGAQDRVEAVAFTDLSVKRLSTSYPQRLRSTVYESNLANHFDLACNSTGATWHVDKAGITQFQLPGEALPISAVFSDRTEVGSLYYVEPSVSYDIKSTVNRLEATNYGWDEAEDIEAQTSLVIENPASMDLHGTYTEQIAVNLYDQPPYEYAVRDRLEEIIDAHDEPQLLVSAVRWNAQQDPTRAAALEIGQRVIVRFNGTDQDSQIVNLSHAITPTRWIITVNLLKL